MAMQQREKILAIAAATVVVAWLGLPRLGDFFLGPIRDAQQRLDGVTEQLTQKTREAVQVKNAGLALKEWRGRSLPPNPPDAQRLYQAWLTDLAQVADFKNVKVTPGRRVPQGKVWTGILVSLDGEATLSQVHRFLFHFNQADLAHRITSLNLESPDSNANVPLRVSLTAEGLAVAGTEPRLTLFPQTTLKADFRSQTSQQTIEIEDVADFPAEPGYRIRIGNEYLNVVDVDEHRWTIEGGVDATSPASHAAGDVVELAAVHPDYAEHTFDDFRSMAANSPFVKPVPESPVVKPEAPVAKVDDSAEQTYLAASITENDEPQAWLLRRGSSSKKVVLRQGSEIDVGDVQAVVVTILSDHIVVRKGESDWRLDLGQNLKSLRKLPQPDQESAEATPEQAVVDEPLSDES